MLGKIEAIVIGGSWGGIDAVIKILSALPSDFKPTMVIALHRPKNVVNSLEGILKKYSKVPFSEPYDKEEIKLNHVYLAPSNYHLLIEKNKIFSLDVSEPVNYFRPSIDVLFESAAEVYGKFLAGILLTGANKDGGNGMKTIAGKGGFTIVQDPSTAASGIMPSAALRLIKPDFLGSVHSITELISSGKEFIWQ
ncbi:MAG: chemotaxis protein CheB [Sporocytophaga sp.]|uniref:chemotaxis protein CheB n=1 Tax=Sporocytophaga sp. TaxID=2231183 RepID=UPI001B1D7ECF|nr:chemotaxis protein CheB [Sporocytophaga sp.]MBO9698650.1 chemotaxis protein CheB [Sporocytophaga sp.]